MKLKTKDGKYFSELGSWRSLGTAIFAVIVLKMVQLDFFSLWTGTFIFAIIIGIFTFFSDIKQWSTTFWQKIREVFKKILQFFIKNWFSAMFVILAVFAIYWFGVRPVIIRKDCSVVKWIEPATLAEPASNNWPECSKVNPFNDPSNPLGSPSFIIDYCHPPRLASSEGKMQRKASDNEYKICLRDNGI
ncbi:MAG: hypothetical protein Q7K40_04765 [bacterium]|nr:hypothetical protein [bacterium]